MLERSNPPHCSHSNANTRHVAAPSDTRLRNGLGADRTAVPTLVLSRCCPVLVSLSTSEPEGRQPVASRGYVAEACARRVNGCMPQRASGCHHALFAVPYCGHIHLPISLWPQHADAHLFCNETSSVPAVRCLGEICAEWRLMRFTLELPGLLRCGGTTPASTLHTHDFLPSLVHGSGPLLQLCAQRHRNIVSPEMLSGYIA